MNNTPPLGDLSSGPDIFLRVEGPGVPWSARETWVGFSIFILLMIGAALASFLIPLHSPLASAWLLIYQPLQFLPIAVILRLRKGTAEDLGFRKATPNVLGLGFGLLVLVLLLSVVNNLVMISLGVELQAEQFSQLMADLDQPLALLVTGILLAPPIEEAVFRGFLFGGLRGRLGWRKAALLSSTLFSAAHLQPAALLPTFGLGFLFAYLYQRSNSIWPGIILHTLVNSFSLCAILVVIQTGGAIDV
jgi:hypothetical protein